MYAFIDPETDPQTALHQAASILAFVSSVVGERSEEFTVPEDALCGFSTIMDGVRQIMLDAAQAMGEPYQRGLEAGKHGALELVAQGAFGPASARPRSTAAPTPKLTETAPTDPAEKSGRVRAKASA